MYDLTKVIDTIDLIIKDMESLLLSNKNVYPPYIKNDLRGCINNRLNEALAYGVELAIYCLGNSIVIIYLSKPDGTSLMDLPDELCGKDTIHMFLNPNDSQMANERTNKIVKDNGGEQVYTNKPKLNKLKNKVRTLLLLLMKHNAYGLVRDNLMNIWRVTRRMESR